MDNEPETTLTIFGVLNGEPLFGEVLGSLSKDQNWKILLDNYNYFQSQLVYGEFILDLKGFRMEIEKIRFLREKLRLLEREVYDPFGGGAGCCGLTLAQCHTLLEVGNKGEASLVDLAAGFGLDTSTLSRTIQGLVVIGLVSRQPSVKDRRFVAISLTNEGRRLYDRIETTFNTYLSQVLELISPEQQDPAIESIAVFADAVKKRNTELGCCTAGQ